MSDIKVIRKGYKCLRCRNEFIPRFPDRKPPISCPKCRSIYWNKPRVRLRRKGQPSIKELARQLNPRRQIVHEELKEAREKEKEKAKDNKEKRKKRGSNAI